jgi:hypothetical protein
MVRILDIKFGEVLGTQEPIKSLPNQGQGVPILCHD